MLTPTVLSLSSWLSCQAHQTGDTMVFMVPDRPLVFDESTPKEVAQLKETLLDLAVQIMPTHNKERKVSLESVTPLPQKHQPQALKWWYVP